MKINELIDQCVEKEFHGQIETKSKNRLSSSVLCSEELQDFFLKLNAIRWKTQRVPCHLVFIDFHLKHIFIQDNNQLVEEIRQQVEKEFQTNSTISIDEIQQNMMVLSMFDQAPYRAEIQSFDEQTVEVYFVDYGNREICSIDSMKKSSESLKKYPRQGKRCRLVNVPETQIDDALKQLETYFESEKLEFEIVRQDQTVTEVLLYHDGHLFNVIPDEERSRTMSNATKRSNDEIFSPPSVALKPSSDVKRQKSQSDHEGLKVIDEFIWIFSFIF